MKPHNFMVGQPLHVQQTIGFLTTGLLENDRMQKACHDARIRMS